MHTQLAPKLRTLLILMLVLASCTATVMAEPVITEVTTTINGNEGQTISANGGEVVITLKGEDLPPTVYVHFGEHALAVTNYNGVCTFRLECPAYTGEMGFSARQVQYRLDIKDGRNNTEHWVTQYKAEVETMSAYPSVFPKTGGMATVLVEGEFPENPTITLGLFDRNGRQVKGTSTWTVTPEDGSIGEATIIVPENNTTYTLHYYIYASVDGGQTWTVGGKSPDSDQSYPLARVSIEPTTQVSRASYEEAP